MTSNDRKSTTLPPLTAAQAKLLARRLRAELSSAGPAVTHSAALEALAHLWGLPDWNTLSAALVADPPADPPAEQAAEHPADPPAHPSADDVRLPAAFERFADPGGRLRQMPRRPGVRADLLAWVATLLPAGTALSETEVNNLLRPVHDDVAMLRRYLVEHGLVTRSGGIYRRERSVPAPGSAAGSPG